MLSKKEYDLLITIINNKCFDRRDNTFRLSNVKIGKVIGKSSSTIDRLFRSLKKLDLIRQVKPFSLSKETYQMLSPQFVFISYTNSDRWFVGALWELLDIDKVYEWSKLCRELNCYIHPCTGEIKLFNWYKIDRKAEEYTCFDRCYRKNSKQVLSGEDNNDSSQYYSINDVHCDTAYNPLTKYDYIWFESINKLSSYDYKLVGDFTTKTVNNIYSVNLEGLLNE